jgi:hypothetical protein
MITEFFHKDDGGMIKMEALPEQSGGPHPYGPDLGYFCIDCKKFVGPKDVTDTKPKENKPWQAKAETPQATATSPISTTSSPKVETPPTTPSTSKT